MRPRPDAMRPRSRPRPETVRPRLRPRPNDLASMPHGPRGLNIPDFTPLRHIRYKVSPRGDIVPPPSPNGRGQGHISEMAKAIETTNSVDGLPA